MYECIQMMLERIIGCAYFYGFTFEHTGGKLKVQYSVAQHTYALEMCKSAARGEIKNKITISPM